MGAKSSTQQEQEPQKAEDVAVQQPTSVAGSSGRGAELPTPPLLRTSTQFRLPSLPLSVSELERNRALRKAYEELIEKGSESPAETLQQIRELILLEGLPAETEEERNSRPVKCTLRGKIWKLLLGVYRIDARAYISYVKQGPSKSHAEIIKDTGRTFANDANYTSRVPEALRVRVLNAYTTATGKSYMQGMNLPVGIFLYVMPEVDAFYAFKAFMTNCCPVYYMSAYIGALRGVTIMNRCLEYVDPRLHNHLQQCRVEPETFRQLIVSLSANLGPLNELLRLWDVYLAFGVHLNVLCVIAQLTLMRDEMLKSSQPSALLQYKHMPEINAPLWLSIAINLVNQIPLGLYDKLARHPIDADLSIDEESSDLTESQSEGDIESGGSRSRSSSIDQPPPSIESFTPSTAAIVGTVTRLDRTVRERQKKELHEAKAAAADNGASR